MIEYPPGATPPERRSRWRGDTTRMFVRLAQMRANRGEHLAAANVAGDADQQAHGLRALLRRLWPRSRGS